MSKKLDKRTLRQLHRAPTQVEVQSVVAWLWMTNGVGEKVDTQQIWIPKAAVWNVNLSAPIINGIFAFLKEEEMKKLFHSYFFRVTTFPSRCCSSFLVILKLMESKLFVFSISPLRSLCRKIIPHQKSESDLAKPSNMRMREKSESWNNLKSLDRYINKFFWCKVEDSGRNGCIYAHGSLGEIGQSWAKKRMGNFGWNISKIYSRYVH